ncbi:hypothetical protein J6590_043600 [Homalodisca vitripennis]|nr:hypothetical protein J6590_043600 [Homalodisca vitripennis]
MLVVFLLATVTLQDKRHERSLERNPNTIPFGAPHPRNLKPAWLRWDAVGASLSGFHHTFTLTLPGENYSFIIKGLSQPRIRGQPRVKDVTHYGQFTSRSSIAAVGKTPEPGGQPGYVDGSSHWRSKPYFIVFF